MATRILNNVTATGTSDPVFVKGIHKHSVQCRFSNVGGSVTALTVVLQGTLDNLSIANAGNAYWFTLQSYSFNATELAALQAIFHVVDHPVECVRLNLSTLTATGTTTINADYLGSGGGR